MCVVNCTPTHTPERSGLQNECAVCVINTNEEVKKQRKEQKWVKKGVIDRKRKGFICPHTEPVSRLVKRGYYFNVCHFLLS